MSSGSFEPPPVKKEAFGSGSVTKAVSSAPGGDRLEAHQRRFPSRRPATAVSSTAFTFELEHTYVVDGERGYLPANDQRRDDPDS